MLLGFHCLTEDHAKISILLKDKNQFLWGHQADKVYIMDNDILSKRQAHHAKLLQSPLQCRQRLRSEVFPCYLGAMITPLALYSRVLIFWSEMCFSSCLRSLTSAPYFPVVPLSARMKWECRLLSTVSLLRGFDMVWYGLTTCSKYEMATN